ncbi:MAG: bifunctional phosphoribosyl-AMP cyclohydrolase/phosphoribosyl-ATP diphosphatase HisIE [Chitinophagales bacterium]
MTLDFEKGNGLIPAIIQDADTHQVLMLAYMNKDALEQTKKEKKVTFYSRSKKRLWTKGESSGNFLHLVDIKPDCDADTLLIRVKPEGPACHKGYDTCFNEKNTVNALFLEKLEKVILSRKESNESGSYTRQLLDSGINKVAQKVGEEAIELLIEAKDDNKDLFLNEAADLLYHTLVLLKAKEYQLNEVIKVLEERHNNLT